MKKHKYIFGSISHGTLRTEDLMPEFVYALRQLRGSIPVDIWQGVQACMRNKERMFEDGPEVVNELDDALQEYAPPYHYFGAHQGDGSNFGFWLAPDFQERMREDGVLEVSDYSEIPDDYTGEVLHVSDHGNPTFCVAKKGKTTVIWSHV